MPWQSAFLTMRGPRAPFADALEPTARRIETLEKDKLARCATAGAPLSAPAPQRLRGAGGGANGRPVVWARPSANAMASGSWSFAGKKLWGLGGCMCTCFVPAENDGTSWRNIKPMILTGVCDVYLFGAVAGNTLTRVTAPQAPLAHHSQLACSIGIAFAEGCHRGDSGK